MLVYHELAATITGLNASIEIVSAGSNAFFDIAINQEAGC